MFKKTLEHVLAWSTHPKAPLYLGAVSFAESSFFPIPPDMLLAPMVLSRPERAWRLATWTTFCSVFGGVAAFAVATFAGDAVSTVLHENGYGESYIAAQAWFAAWGFWAVLVAGFSPIPYKVFAFAAGGMSMLLPAFVLASIAGRGGRFFLVAALCARGGPRMQSALKRYVDRIGWSMVAVGLVWFLVHRFG
jgi:membrane protein YqaA with SNARE-associated domain